MRLIERTTRRFAVTEAGKRHVETYRTMLNALARLDASAADIDISGTVVVTAPELFGRIRVLPVIESFLAVHPQTQVRLLFLNRVVDLVGEGVDVAIRLADLPDSSMTAIRLGEIRRLTCAAPSYLAKHPPPHGCGSIGQTFLSWISVDVRLPYRRAMRCGLLTFIAIWVMLFFARNDDRSSSAMDVVVQGGWMPWQMGRKRVGI